MLRTWKLTVTENQAAILSRACELYARLYMGQLKEVVWEITEQFDDRDKYLEACRLVDEASRLVQNGLGIRNQGVPDQSRVAWDIYQVVRQALAYARRPEGDSWCVDFDTPLKSSAESLCSIEPADGLPDPRPAQVRAADELREVIGTDDLVEAVRRVKEWKSKANIYEKTLRTMR